MFEARRIEETVGLRTDIEVWLNYSQGQRASTVLNHLVAIERGIRQIAALASERASYMGSVDLPRPVRASLVSLADVRPGSIQFRFKDDSDGKWEREVNVSFSGVTVLVALALGWAVVTGDGVAVLETVDREARELIVEVLSDLPISIVPQVHLEP